MKCILYSKTGVWRGLPNFLIFDPNINCGYSLELSRLCLEHNLENIKTFLLKLFTTYITWACFPNVND